MHLQTGTERLYRGRFGQDGGQHVDVEGEDGQPLEPLRPCAGRFGWGSRGSASAYLAWCLLVDALEGEANCPLCEGTASIGLDPATLDFIPYRAGTSGFPSRPIPCPAACREGKRRLPHRLFGEVFVAAWGREWTMRRSTIVAWVHGIEGP